MSEGIVRRHVDARIISYAMSVLKEKDVIPDLRLPLHGCASIACNAGAGLAALIVALGSAAESPVVVHRLDARQREHVQSLLSALRATIQNTWEQEIKEILEVIIVMAAQTAETAEDEMRFRQWAQGVYLDIRPLAILDDDVTADVEDTAEPEVKRQRVRKARSSRETYQQERLENLVTRAVAAGVDETRAVLVDKQVQVVGADARKRERALLKVRGSLREAEELCKLANEEIRKMRVGETFP